jgi:hypothetical protein
MCYNYTLFKLGYWGDAYEIIIMNSQEKKTIWDSERKRAGNVNLGHKELTCECKVKVKLFLCLIN